MNRLHHSVPLAFLLALAADGSNANVVEANGPAPVLTSGMLAALLADINTSSTARPHELPSAEPKMAQLPTFRNFGFYNCFTGAWRNC
jgi:hypothetical protein